VHGAQPLHDGDSVAYGQFPLVYTAPEDEAGMVQIRLQAADAQGGTTAAETLNIAYGDTRLRIEWRDGWNAFALPFTPEITDPRVLFARPDGTGVWYSGELWEWNARLQVFRVARTLRAGTGYYAHCRTGSPVRFMVALDPTVFPNGRIELARKWSFVGAHGFGEKTARITDAAGRPFPNRRIYECTPDAQARFAADGKLRRARAGWFYSPTPQIIELRLNHQ